MHLSGTRVLLTGATGGIGHALAHTLRAAGAHLVLTGRRADVLEGLAAQLQAELLPCDLADRASLDDLVAGCGDIDVLVANAALPGSGHVVDFSQGEIDRALEVNLRAPIALSRALLPGMLARRRGHQVFVGSVLSLSASPGSAVYSATKFGIRGYAHGLRQDLHGSGVSCSVVLPGFVRGAGMFADSGAALPRGIRTSSPRQVAEGVLRAVVKDKGEIVVAPREVQAGAVLGTVAPGLAAAVQRRAGAARTAAAMAQGQRHKR